MRQPVWKAGDLQSTTGHTELDWENVIVMRTVHHFACTAWEPKELSLGTQMIYFCPDPPSSGQGGLMEVNLTLLSPCLKEVLIKLVKIKKCVR